MRFLRNMCEVSLKDRYRSSDVRESCGLKEGVVPDIQRDHAERFPVGRTERRADTLKIQSDTSTSKGWS
ncbi:hypothetical protein EVAR_93202_1 [Eumeta japonica]|uniref:Uncharacterized protein n=1 Tax=Eumeta variegata TaxID=151549 RepID=A0A4C1TY38_EUMVA|nr:hypothetical protein EVAR_93202_1 [Eumeta japonica]